MRAAHFVIRKAVADEAARIRTMQEFSLRVLGAAFYRPEEIEAFVAQVGTMDGGVLAEGHYFVATDESGEILGSGGWSQLRPRYAGQPGRPAGDPSAATIRSVFVAPAAARRGMGSAIMARAEADAAAAGITRLRLLATLSGEALYRRLGYMAGEPRCIMLSGGIVFRGTDMEKALRAREAAA